MSVYEITLADPTEPGRPAERVLRISVVDQLAFLAICTEDEGNPTTTSTVVEEIAVSLPSLRDALVLFGQDTFREEHRERDGRGGMKARIGGIHIGSVPL